MAVFDKRTWRSPAVNRSFPIHNTRNQWRNVCIIPYSCTKYGGVNQVKFSEAEYIAIHLNIVDRGVPQMHLEIDRLQQIDHFHSQHEESVKKRMHHSIFLHKICGKLIKWSFRRPSKQLFTWILSIVVFREDTWRSPAVNRSFPFTTRAIIEGTHVSFHIPAPNIGEVNQVKFSEAEQRDIHLEYYRSQCS